MPDDRVWTGDYGFDTWANDGPVMLALGWLLATVEPGTGPIYPLAEWTPVRDACCAVAHTVPYWTAGDLATVKPLGAICHRDLELGEHTDRLAPEGTDWNATILYGRGCAGGALAITGHDETFPPNDPPRVVIFDGQRPHHVEPFVLDDPDGFRIAFTVYLQETMT